MNGSLRLKKCDTQIADTNLSLFNLPYLSSAQGGGGSLAVSVKLQELTCRVGARL